MTSLQSPRRLCIELLRLFWKRKPASFNPKTYGKSFLEGQGKQRRAASKGRFVEECILYFSKSKIAYCRSRVATDTCTKPSTESAAGACRCSCWDIKMIMSSRQYDSMSTDLYWWCDKELT